MFNFPNIISLTRIIIAPVFMGMFLSGNNTLIKASCVLFFIGVLTDSLDGWYARKFKEVTTIGKFVDPLADKILTTAAFLSFVFINIMPWWMVIIIIIRDFSMTFLRVYGEIVDMPVVTSYTAKVKTAIQMMFILLILSLFFIKYSGFTFVTPQTANAIIYSGFTYLSMLVLTIFTFLTIIEYFFQNNPLIIHFFSYITKKKFANE